MDLWINVYLEMRQNIQEHFFNTKQNLWKTPFKKIEKVWFIWYT